MISGRITAKMYINRNFLLSFSWLKKFLTLTNLNMWSPLAANDGP